MQGDTDGRAGIQVKTGNVLLSPQPYTFEVQPILSHHAGADSWAAGRVWAPVMSCQWSDLHAFMRAPPVAERDCHRSSTAAALANLRQNSIYMYVYIYINIYKTSLKAEAALCMAWKRARVGSCCRKEYEETAVSRVRRTASVMGWSPMRWVLRSRQ
jgi:hypothetical protein